MMLLPDYHLQFTLCIKYVFGQFRRVLKVFKKSGRFLKRARAGLRVKNHDTVPTLVT